MAVDTKHSKWNENIYTWTAIRDCYEGEARIKFKNEMYLPIPAAMLNLPAAPSFQATRPSSVLGSDDLLVYNTYNPNTHHIQAYASYKSRARFPNLVSYLYRGLMGLANADRPSVELPDDLGYLLEERASSSGLNLYRLYVKLLGEVLLTGRYALVLEPDPEEKKIHMVEYAAENITNWFIENQSPRMVVFRELFNDADEEFEYKPGERYLAASFMPDYSVRTYEKNLRDPVMQVFPTFSGKSPIGFSPITFYGSANNDIHIDPAPLAPVANTAIQIYMKDADLAQAEYLTCNPTLIMTGVAGTDSSVHALGPTVALKFGNPNAKVFYTETDTSALEFMHKHMQELMEQAVVYGAQLLDSSKKSAESAETARLRQTSVGATLRSVVTTIGNGMETQLKNMARWMNLSQSAIDKIKFKPLTEFGTALTPQEQEALVQSWLAGAISQRTLLGNFQKAGILLEGVSIDDEIAQIESETPEEPEVTLDENGQPIQTADGKPQTTVAAVI